MRPRSERPHGTSGTTTAFVLAALLAIPLLVLGCATGAPAEAHAADSVQLVVRVFAAWSPDPQIAFDVRQTADGASPATSRPSGANRMGASAFETWLERTEGEHPEGLRTAPRLLALVGEPATIRIGAPPEAFHAIELATHRDGRADRHDVVLLTLRYEGGGFGVRPPATEFADGDRIRADADDLALRRGETAFVLAHGMIGAPMHLVAVTRER